MADFSSVLLNNTNDSVLIKDSNNHILKVSVIDPILEKNDSNPYVNYHLQIISNLPKLTNKDNNTTIEYTINHRYSDFDILRKCLKFDYPTLLIPPLPTKQRLEYIKGGRFTNEFITKRCNSLNLFIKRILNHPILSNCEIFLIFLGKDNNIWDNYKKNINIGNNSNNNNDLQIENVTDYLMNSFKKVNTETKFNKNFKEIEFNRSKLNENLIKFDKIFNKVISKQDLLSKEMNLFSDEFNKLSVLLNNDYNGKFRNLNQIDNNTKLIIEKFKLFSNNLSLSSNQYIEINKFLEFNYLNNLKDLEHYIISFNNLSKLKDYKILDYEMLNNYLEKTINERDNLKNGGSLISSSTESTLSFITKKLEFFKNNENNDNNNSNSNETTLINDRIDKLNERIELLNSEILKSKSVYEKFENDLLNEWKNFQNIKDLEINDSLNDLSNEYCKLYENSLKIWENFNNNNNNNSNSDEDKIRFNNSLDDNSKIDKYFNNNEMEQNSLEIENLLKNQNLDD